MSIWQIKGLEQVFVLLLMAKAVISRLHYQTHWLSTCLVLVT
jgi:hypothetical protein